MADQNHGLAFIYQLDLLFMLFDVVNRLKCMHAPANTVTAQSCCKQEQPDILHCCHDDLRANQIQATAPHELGMQLKEATCSACGNLRFNK